MRDYAAHYDAIYRRATHDAPFEQLRDMNTEATLRALYDASVALDNEVAVVGGPRDVVRVFQRPSGHWYWRRMAANNRSVAIGGEGYEHKRDAIAGAVRCCPDLADQDFEVEPYVG